MGIGGGRGGGAGRQIAAIPLARLLGEWDRGNPRADFLCLSWLSGRGGIRIANVSRAAAFIQP